MTNERRIGERATLTLAEWLDTRLVAVLVVYVGLRIHLLLRRKAGSERTVSSSCELSSRSTDVLRCVACVQISTTGDSDSVLSELTWSVFGFAIMS